ncbi:MAG: hypothetical protein IPG03_05795 [Candidatus Microthrix sp.]|nr:hypothetical protein [Candidatus Microthrix sp.]
MLTQALAMCQSAALGVLAFMDHAPIGAFYVVAFIGGLSLAVDNPVRRPFVNELVPIGDVANAVSLYSAMNSLAHRRADHRRRAHRDRRVRLDVHDRRRVLRGRAGFAGADAP